MRVTSLPASRPKSSSPASGGMALKPARSRNTVSGLRARCRCLVWGISGRKTSQAQCVQPPVDMSGGGLFAVPPACQERRHQGKDQQCDDSRFGRYVAEPARPDEEAAHEEPGDAHRHSHGPDRHEVEIESPETPVGRKEAKPEARGDVVERNERKRTEAPEDEGVRQARQRPLPDHLPLRHHLPQEFSNARADRRDLEIRGFPGRPNDLQNPLEPYARTAPARQSGSRRTPPVPPTMRPSC